MNPELRTRFPRRPTRTHRAIVAKASEALAPAVHAWFQKQENPLEPEAVVRLLEKVLRYGNDGYDIAREIEMTHYYEPDAELVAILAGAGALLAAAQEDAFQAWLMERNLTAPAPGTKVTHHWKPQLGVGEVVRNEAEAKAVVIFPHLSRTIEHRINWEHLVIV